MTVLARKQYAPACKVKRGCWVVSKGSISSAEPLDNICRYGAPSPCAATQRPPRRSRIRQPPTFYQTSIAARTGRRQQVAAAAEIGCMRQLPPRALARRHRQRRCSPSWYSPGTYAGCADGTSIFGRVEGTTHKLGRHITLVQKLFGRHTQARAHQHARARTSSSIRMRGSTEQLRSNSGAANLLAHQIR